MILKWLATILSFQLSKFQTLYRDQTRSRTRTTLPRKIDLWLKQSEYPKISMKNAWLSHASSEISSIISISMALCCRMESKASFGRTIFMQTTTETRNGCGKIVTSTVRSMGEMSFHGYNSSLYKMSPHNWSRSHTKIVSMRISGITRPGTFCLNLQTAQTSRNYLTAIRRSPRTSSKINWHVHNLCRLSAKYWTRNTLMPSGRRHTWV